MRLTAGPNLRRDKRKEEERTQTGGEVGGPGSSLKSYVCVRSLPGWLLRCPPYQTFQRQRGWLQALSGWSWNSMFCTAVITSASHKQGRAPHQQQGRALCLSICTLEKNAPEFHSHRGKGHIFSTHFCQGPSSFPWPRHFRHPSQPHDVVQLIPAPHCPVGLGREEAGEATRTPLGDRCSSGKTPPLVFFFSSPLSKQPTL